MFGRMMSERLGKLHFWPTFLALNVVFGGQLLIGWAGMQRRLYDPSAYEFLAHLLPWNVWISRAAYVLGAAQLVFVVNFFVEPALGQAGARQPVGGRHAGVDAAVAAAASQLRRHPDRRARAARARPPRCARARQGLAGPGRGRVVSREASRRSALERRRRHGGLPGRVRDAVRGAAVRVRGRARRRRRPGRRPGRRRFRAAPPPATAFC